MFFYRLMVVIPNPQFLCVWISKEFLLGTAFCQSPLLKNFQLLHTRTFKQNRVMNYCQPKLHALVFREIPQNYCRFAACFDPPNPKNGYPLVNQPRKMGIFPHFPIGNTSPFTSLLFSHLLTEWSWNFISGWCQQ